MSLDTFKILYVFLGITISGLTYPFWEVGGLPSDSLKKFTDSVSFLRTLGPLECLRTYRRNLTVFGSHSKSGSFALGIWCTQNLKLVPSKFNNSLLATT